MKPILAVVLTAVAVGLVAVAAASAAKSPKLKGSVGPGFTISMSVKPKKAGTYSITVTDKASSHNFHISGPGLPKSNTKKVTVATAVGATGTITLKNLKLQAGKTYRFVCDPHASAMKGSFKVPT
ncbi:MAG TPA: plastocyanin/azurin family copper-binding protein [Gaiellaceae bacterium]|jgi:plastocyanin